CARHQPATAAAALCSARAAPRSPEPSQRNAARTAWARSRCARRAMYHRNASHCPLVRVPYSRRSKSNSSCPGISASIRWRLFTSALRSGKMNKYNRNHLEKRTMDLADLRIFRSVVHAGGITRAAEQLHRVQSNVTTRVKQLEDELGVQLFIREGKRLHLSP